MSHIFIFHTETIAVMEVSVTDMQILISFP